MTKFKEWQHRLRRWRLIRRRSSKTEGGMGRIVAVAIGLFLLSCSPLRALEGEPTCVVPVGSESATDEPATGAVDDFHDVPGGLLVAAAGRLLRYDGAHIIEVEGEEMPSSNPLFQDVPGGVLITGLTGLLFYDGARVVQVKGDPTGKVYRFQVTPGGLLIGGDIGMFRYRDGRVARVPGDPPGRVKDFYRMQGGLIVAADNGLFRYEGERVTRLTGELAVGINEVRDVPGGLLLATTDGLYRYDGVRTTRVEGSATGPVLTLRDAPGGLVLDAEKGLFRLDGARVVPLEGVPKGEARSFFGGRFHAVPGSLLVAVGAGDLFRYDGVRLTRVQTEETGYIAGFHDVQGGVLLAGSNGLYRYDGAGAVHVPGEPTSDINDFFDLPGGPLIAAMNGLFRYDGARITRVAGTPTGPVYAFHTGPSGLLSATENGLLRVVLQPLSSSRVVLTNATQLQGIAPSNLGVPTRWTMAHPCAALSSQLQLYVVATNANGEDVNKAPAVGFERRDDAMSFGATPQVPYDGKWTFRVVSTAWGIEKDVGQPAEPIAFATPSILGWLERWSKLLAECSLALLVALNLVTFAAARYWAAAWRLSTDKLWGKKVLCLQSLLLQHWRIPQLWLLDLYVQRFREELDAGKSLPYLPLPLTSPDCQITDSNAVLMRLGSARHLWIQGGSGMGKTAMFLHLRQSHFSGPERSAFAIFARFGYVLVPIEARRFPEAPLEEKGASAWVVACARSVLSERGLSFGDGGLLRSMLSQGTLAIAVDGLNEVARRQAVTAFAAEFPAAPIFVTSQEPGERPFETWHLPSTIAEHVDGLLTLYLGAEQGEVLARRLREIELVQYLRSGYDVRLLIDLAKPNPEGANLPRDRMELYRAAVASAWPKGDERLELLQAAAWKLLSERGPNEDKRRLIPEQDAPKDLLEQLEAVRERSGRNIRLIRGAPPAYEFVHDQMNAYLAACWFANRPAVAVMKELLETTKLWQDGLEAQRTLWGFVAAMLDLPRVEALWIFAGDDERRTVFGRALAHRAEQEGWPLTRPPLKATPAAVPS